MPEKTYRNPETGSIFSSSGQHIKSLEDYQSGVASGQYSGSPLDFKEAPWYSTINNLKGGLESKFGKPDETSDVTTINTDDAISDLNRNKEKLDNLSALPQDEKKKEDKAPTLDETKTSSLTFEEANDLFGSDFSGITQNPDGTFTPSASAYTRIGITGMEDSADVKLEKDLQELDNTITTLSNNFLNYNIENDPAFQAETQNIAQQYNTMRSQMTTINTSRQRALETLGYRTGSTQYAGAVQLGIVGEEIKQGDQRLAEITRQENSAKSAARKAFEDRNYNKFAQSMDALDTLRDNKADELTNYNKKLVEANKLIQEQAKQEFEVTKWLTDQTWKEKQLDIDYAKFDRETAKFNFEISKFQEDIRQFGEESALDKLKLEIAQSDNAFDKQIKFETLLNSIPEGQEVNIGGMTGTGRKSSDLTIDQQLKLEKDGYYINDDGVVKQKPIIDQALEAAKSKLNELGKLLKTDKGLDTAVGPNPLARYSPVEWFGSKKSNFVASVEQIVSQESLDSLIAAKARGATFGALSDTEMNILRQAATKIGSWRITDPDDSDRVIGYKTTEGEFKKELEKIQNSTQKIIDYAEKERDEIGGQQINPTKIIDDYYKENPNKRQYIDSLESEGLSDQEKLEVLGISFSNGGGGTPTASGMRTDRHNNPTAFTIDIAKQAGLKEGIDYKVGDPFPNNPNLKTARLLGNPVEQTIKVIDNISFYTNSGKQRWTHTAMSKEKWNKLSYAEKKNIVKKMYQAEGNKGLLNKYFA